MLTYLLAYLLTYSLTCLLTYLLRWCEALEEAVRGCVYAALGVATRTPQMKKDEAELMAKTPKELHALLAYLNSPVEAAITDKG